MSEQRRGRRIAMSATEVDDFLTTEWTCRLGSVRADGTPHVTPLWFVWDGSSIWLNSLVSSQRWTNLTRDPRVSLVVDTGGAFLELRGVEMEGRVEVVGEVPRGTDPLPEVEEAERLWGVKYLDGGPFRSDGRHGWLRVSPSKTVSWDFRKIQSQ